MVLKLIISGTLAILFAFSLDIIKYRYGDIRLGRNAILASIGLGTICFICLNMMIEIITENLRNKEINKDRQILQSAIKEGTRLAEESALEGLKQKAKAVKEAKNNETCP